mmetsp:Transcript_4543/g.12037  ORF Transcript_4543/g.12037 Transcript_4543/m.12037 type:complete len:342 (+) Transcript_4543:39-1064(+)|eukprot:CAMPEP_0115851470 /NCGR_PEP_ID=MMETSP0287-20121206/12499_1 /TAXON_ID=412157 /ORGANISM="Chrysochromulina rotalis, Strain UIO044" /LENGTH=341 /DNA_ID=CAMNT_0003305505 /DNA_START=24 /DNA_END=1049 /DNA_ORIENTATION=-
MGDLIERLLEHDVGEHVASYLGPITVSTLRGVSKSVLTASSSRTGGVQLFWRNECLARAGHGAVQPDVVCWLECFVSHHGETYMRTLRKERLEAALHERGLKFREDSWLCAEYVARRPQASSLNDVVDEMEIMAFLHRRTEYVNIRESIHQDRWLEACEMASDAAHEGDSPDPSLPSFLPAVPSSYHVPISPQEASERARRRAIEMWARASNRTPLNTIRVAPRSLQGKVGAILQWEKDVWAAPDEPQLYTGLPKAAKRARRADAQCQVRRMREEEEAILAPHLEALNRVAASVSGTLHHFPASLTSRQRSRLHDEAEELEVLAHASEGQGSERHLVVWRD